MRVISREQIARALSFTDLIPALRQGFVDYAKGLARAAPITNIDFGEVNGEMHIKAGYLESAPDACVKIVTCFYDNPAKGLPTRDGCIVVADRTDGRMKAVLCDEGLITDMRTAGASAVAVDFLQSSKSVDLGLIGTGTQAYWHILAIKAVREIKEVRIWGRDPKNSKRLADRVEREVELPTVIAALENAIYSDVVVSATPARVPVITTQTLKPGSTIVAMGSDAVGKREIAEEAIRKVSRIIADSLPQCRKYGELQWLTHDMPARELGRVLAGIDDFRPESRDVVLFDSTGVGFQDAIGAKLVLDAIG
jgi:ornithine cyclodeaminase